MSRLALSVLTLCGLALSFAALADERDSLKVGPLPDGRIMVPTNQILDPAGQQVLFAGRPVDLCLVEEGRTLFVKNMRNLVFIETATGRIRARRAECASHAVSGTARGLTSW